MPASWGVMRLIRHAVQWLLDRPWVATAIGFVVFSIALGCLIYTASTYVYDKHAAEVLHDLEHYANHNRDIVARRVVAAQKAVDLVADVVGHYIDSQPTELQHLLDGLVATEGFSALSIQTSAGQRTSLFGSSSSPVDKKRLAALSEDVSTIVVSTPYIPGGETELVIYRYIGLTSDGTVRAVCAQLPTNEVMVDLDTGLHTDVGQWAVQNGQGDILFAQLVDSADQASYKEVSYKVPVGINDWVFVIDVSDDYLEQVTTDSMAVLLQFALGTALIMFGVFTCFWLYQYAMRRRAQLGEHCFRALAERSNDIVFEWDLESERMVSASNVEKVFGRGVEDPEEFYRFVVHASSSGLVHEEDLSIFEQAYEDVLAGRPVDECRYRAMNATGEWIWCSLQSTVVLDFSGRPYRVVGTVSDVDKQVRESESLRLLAQRDLMTGLYNKVSVEQLVISYLESHREIPGECAFIIVDMDDLKILNDTHGHPAGDYVITELAKALRDQFRDTDIIGRIGGDEFVVFIKKVPDVGAFLDRLVRVKDELAQTYQFDTGNYFATVSMGTVVADYTVSYSELYRQADEQLYETKRESKDISGQPFHC